MGIADHTQGHQGKQEDHRGVGRRNRGMEVLRGMRAALLRIPELRQGMRAGETRQGMMGEGSTQLPDTHQHNYMSEGVELQDTHPSQVLGRKATDLCVGGHIQGSRMVLHRGNQLVHQEVGRIRDYGFHPERADHQGTTEDLRTNCLREYLQGRNWANPPYDMPQPHQDRRDSCRRLGMS